MDGFSYHMPTRVIFENGCLDRLPEHIIGDKVRIVTGIGGSMRKAGVLKRVGCLLEGFDIEFFDKIEADPSCDTIDDGSRACRGADCILAIGGGSPIDAAKAISACIGCGCSAKDLLWGKANPKPGPPIIAVATTAGTGSEVTQVSVLTDRKKRLKKSFRQEYMYPLTALDDPELTITMPFDITAQTGLDALSHALEALVAAGSQPITDSLCIEAAKLIIKSIEGACRFPKDMVFRKDMMLGSLMAGFGITVAGTGLAHGISYGIWKATGMGHGMAVGLLTPHIIRFNMGFDGGKYDRVAQALGYQDGLELAKGIESINESLGIPKNLGDAGIGVDDKRWLVEAALEGSSKKNPRPVKRRDANEFVEGLL